MSRSRLNVLSVPVRNAGVQAVRSFRPGEYPVHLVPFNAHLSNTGKRAEAVEEPPYGDLKEH